MSPFDSQDSFLTPTPKTVKILMIVHLTLGCLSGFFNSLLGVKLKFSMISFFALSLKGLFKGFLWQPLTFIFVPEIEGSLNFYFLFSLCFDTYLLWLIGCRVCNNIGAKKFLKLFFIPPIISTLCVLPAFGSFAFSKSLYGLSYGLFPLVAAYFSLNPQAKFSFFTPYPVRLRWVGLALILLFTLQDIANLNYVALCTHLFLLMISHLYVVVALKRQGPFSYSHPFDQWLLSKLNRPSSEKIIQLYDTSETTQSFFKRKREQQAKMQTKTSFIQKMIKLLKKKSSV